jgi:hypothetical protein
MVENKNIEKIQILILPKCEGGSSKKTKKLQNKNYLCFSFTKSKK